MAIEIGTIRSLDQAKLPGHAGRQASAKRIRAVNKTYATKGINRRWLKQRPRGGGWKHFVLAEI